MRTPLRFLLAAVLLIALVAAGSVALAAPGKRSQRPAAVAAARPAPTARPAKAGKPVAGRDFVRGRMLVGFRAGASSATRVAALRAVGARAGRTLGRSQLALVTSGADVPAVAGRLAAQPGVAFAEPDWIRHVNACDPSVCWYLDSAGVNAFPVHAAGRRGAGSTVAVLDTGVAAISELSGQVTGRWVCVTGTCATDTGAPDLGADHGTMVASLVAAVDDADGITGVAPEAKIKSFLVGTDEGIPTDALVAALNFVASNAAAADVDVVNMSLGGSQSSQAEQNAVAAVLASGKTVVASAGNGGDYYPSYPASYPGVLSVGATTQARAVASFSSFGKVDVVAPGENVPVIDPNGTLQHVDGTSFSSPIVAGLIALRLTTGTGGPARARLAVEGTATAGAGGGDAKKFGHGVASASGYVDSHDGGAFLVLEGTGPGGRATYATSGQLANPTTSLQAHVLKTDGSLTTVPGSGTASFSVNGSSFASGVAFGAASGGVFTANSGASPALARGTTVTAAASVDGSSENDSMPVRVLRANDQAPGVPLSGSGDAAWTQSGTGLVAGDDVDDVYAVYLAAGDTLDVGVFRDPGQGGPIAYLYAPGTTDIYSQFERIVACGGTADPSCDPALHYRATVTGTYLVDLFTFVTDPVGYHLTWAATGSSPLPISVGVAACSPNGDGHQDLCAWTAGALSGRTITSFVTRSFTGIREFAGAGAKTWNGTNGSGAAQPDGPYALRVLYAQGTGRKLLRVFPLILDRARPVVGNLVVAPNPFEPVPKDGDRDTTTFAINSNERSRLRVLVYKSGTTTLLRTITTGFLPAGRQRVSWNGKTLSGTQLRGTFAWQMEIIDPAGNLYRTLRHSVRIL
ncbi:MAG TPA: S8 family serine peptidase [Actinomycetes bacterium]